MILYFSSPNVSMFRCLNKNQFHQFKFVLAYGLSKTPQPRRFRCFFTHKLFGRPKIIYLVLYSIIQFSVIKSDRISVSFGNMVSLLTRIDPVSIAELAIIKSTFLF